MTPTDPNSPTEPITLQESIHPQEDSTKPQEDSPTVLPQKEIEEKTEEPILQEVPYSRFSYVCSEYFQYDSISQPTGYDNRVYQDVLKSTDEPYTRTVVIGEKLHAIDLGWIKKVSYLSIVNLGSNRAINPVQQALVVPATTELTIEIGTLLSGKISSKDKRTMHSPSGVTQLFKDLPDIFDLFARIKPSMTLLFMPTNIDRLRLRSVDGSPCRVTITIYPG